MKGIDVSKHQGNVNWSHVKADCVKFAILRAGYGKEISQKDRQFENNYAGCKSNGIPCGAYWYSYAMSETEARQEAVVCLQVLKGKTFEFPIYYDIEEKKQFALGKAKCTAIAKAFFDVLEKAGYWVGLYSSKSFLDSYFDESLRKRYAVWVAQYNTKCTYSCQYGIWQKSSTGKVYGIAGNVDINECYFDYPTAIKKAGRNGFWKNTNIASNVSNTASSLNSHGVASTSKIAAGYKIQLDHMELFASSDAKKRANVLTGFYYVTDGKIVNGRFRISAKQNGAVTGWIDKKYTNETG